MRRNDTRERETENNAWKTCTHLQSRRGGRVLGIILQT